MKTARKRLVHVALLACAVSAVSPFFSFSGSSAQAAVRGAPPRALSDSDASGQRPPARTHSLRSVDIASPHAYNAALSYRGERGDFTRQLEALEHEKFKPLMSE